MKQYGVLYGSRELGYCGAADSIAIFVIFPVANALLCLFLFFIGFEAGADRLGRVFSAREMQMTERMVP